MIMNLKSSKIINNFRDLSIICLFLLFILPTNANAEFWVTQSSSINSESKFLDHAHNSNIGKFNEFGVYRAPLKSKQTNSGFFLHNDIGIALTSLGVNLLNSDLKQRNDWAVKDRGIAGYGYHYNDEATLLLGLNLPNSNVQDSAYISFTIGGSW